MRRKRAFEAMMTMKKIDVAAIEAARTRLIEDASTAAGEFNVGVLPAGTYSVVAQTQYTSPLPGCSLPLLSQSASFTVSDPVGVPTSNPIG